VEDDKAALLAEEVMDWELRGRRLGPSLRTEYRRTAFQLSSSNAIRISLDTQLRFTHETPSAGGGESETSPGGRSHEFPYAVLEVKLQEAAPRWIEEVLEVGLNMLNPVDL
jgi:SPX domain protein involved in polyphosphate accumulation